MVGRLKRPLNVAQYKKQQEEKKSSTVKKLSQYPKTRKSSLQEPSLINKQKSLKIKDGSSPLLNIKDIQDYYSRTISLTSKPLMSPVVIPYKPPSENVFTRSLKKAKTVYRDVDVFLDGALPFAVRRGEAKTIKKIRAARDREALIAPDLREKKASLKLKEQEEQFQQRKDIISQDWLENYGLFESEEEKAFRELQKEQAFRKSVVEFSPAIQQTKEDYESLPSSVHDEVTGAFKETQSNNFTPIVLIGVGVLALTLMSR